MDDNHPLAQLLDRLQPFDPEGSSLVLAAMHCETELLDKLQVISDLCDKGLVLGNMDPMTCLRRIQQVTG